MTDKLKLTRYESGMVHGESWMEPMSDGDYCLYDDVLRLMENMAQEFDRRAILPEYGDRERARILACSTWIRDMATELGSND